MSIRLSELTRTRVSFDGDHAQPERPAGEGEVAIRVRGKGIVLVVGCGHQGMPRLLARAARLFDELDPLEKRKDQKLAELGVATVRVTSTTAAADTVAAYHAARTTRLPVALVIPRGVEAQDSDADVDAALAALPEPAGPVRPIDSALEAAERTAPTITSKARASVPTSPTCPSANGRIPSGSRWWSP